MPIRKVRFTPGERYHLCARGVGKQTLFFEKRDYVRFLFLLLHFQAPISFFNISRQINYFVRRQAFNISKEEKEKIFRKKQVSLEGFAIMPNHVHISLREVTKRGVSTYMQRLLTSYAKYFNVKYKKTGHTFEGPFRAVRIESNEQLLYLSAYIHRNPCELPGWENTEHNYPWSSYPDYAKENRWGELLDPSIILDQFNNKQQYQKFVKESGAKQKTFPVNNRVNLVLE